MVKNKSDKLHNKGCHHKGQYNVTFFYIKGLSIHTNKRMGTFASLYEGPIFYFYVFTFMQRVSSIPSHSYLLFSWQASCVGERSKHIWPFKYILDHELLLLTIIYMISELGGETLSPYLSLCSMDAICSKNML